MSSSPARSRWRFVIAPRWLAWHVFTVGAVFGMLWLGDWQFHRAEAGNALSWAYTFEWPIFAVLGVVFWVKTIVDEAKPAPPAGSADGGAADPAAGRLPGAAGVLALRGQARQDCGPAGDEAADDPELEEYNAYLARLNQQVQGHGRWHGLR